MRRRTEKVITIQVRGNENLSRDRPVSAGYTSQESEVLSQGDKACYREGGGRS